MEKKIVGFIGFCFLVIVAAGCGIYPQLGFDAEVSGEARNPELESIVFGPLGGYWNLVSIETDDRERIVPLFPELLPTLKFYPDGRFTGFSGCNKFGGRLKIEKDKLRFSNMMSSSKGCTGPVGQLENFVFWGLSQVDDYSVQQDRLYLKRGSSVLMTYKRRVNYEHSSE